MVRATGETHITNIRDVFARRDWNTVEDANGNKEFAVERLLAEHIDGPAASALENLRQGEFPLLEWRREAIAMFMSAQLNRGKLVRDNLAKFISEVSGLMLRMSALNYSDEQWISAIGEVLSPELRRQLVNDNPGFDIRPTNGMLLKTMLSSVTDIAGYLAQRTWTLARFDEPCLFAGEEPVLLINPSGETGGFGVVTAERIYMPVSPTTALLLSHPWTSWPERRVHGTRELAQRLNWAMLNYSTNEHLLMRPDVVAHPLPGVVTLAQARDAWWPWGEDPKSAPPVHLSVVSDGRQHHPPLARRE